MNKRNIKEMQITTYLDSIKECTDIAKGYISGEYIVNDLEELIVALSCIPEDIEEIKKILYEITSEYEKEIMELKYE